ncbi:MAG: protoporphyrinogen oxidase [Nitrospirae bacterium]|nr:protoporphyrinogen oxidase [Nitrospirota bacterium]MBF0534602.1 protoporphyrinogen oxidase [Nitrospirota bacterium]MBF0616354.1 protoporphyrinogen oxidase [Nitrospirota bacterium]
MDVLIAGGGISGLSLAYLLLRSRPELDVAVYESETKTGGKIWTEKHDGYTLEGGVNGFLDNRPNTLELADMLNLQPLSSSDKARKRYIYKDGKLRQVMESPLGFMTSDLLSLSGKLRLLYEAVAPRNCQDDETLRDFAVRRLGREAFETLIEPMASGIYAGDASKLSLKSCFPKINNLEQTYGGLIRGMVRMKWDARKSKREVSAGPGGKLTSFEGGMGSLIAALKENLGQRVKTSTKVVSIDKAESGYVVTLDNGETVTAGRVVLSTPAYASAEILRDFDASMTRELAQIPYPSVAVVCMGFKVESFTQVFDGFGFLVPSVANKRILGTLCDSCIFPGRAPEGFILLRTMIGGARASESANKSDAELTTLVMEEISSVMGIQGEPELARIYRHQRAIPQYNVGHATILERLQQLQRKHSGLYLHGNSYKGIGVNDCIESSFKLSGEILNSM